MFENLNGFQKYIVEQQNKGKYWRVCKENHGGVPVIIYSRNDVVVTFNQITGDMLSYVG